jgi:alpha,alpha-trehalase
MPNNTLYPPIADYGIVGDCHTAALVARDGSVDWLCPRRFDAPAVFCRLLDAHRGGYLRTVPGTWSSIDRTYVGDTNVLQTEFSNGHAQLRLTDFMPVHQRSSRGQGQDVGTSQRLIRRLEALGSDVEVHIVFKPTFDFARESTHVQIVAGRGVVACQGSDYLTLACQDAEFTCGSGGEMRACVQLRAGERRWLAVTSAEDSDRAAESLAPTDCDGALQRTIDYWKTWVARCTYQGRYRQQVLRSALVLKLLIYEPTGAIVAAPTASLPEEIGGARNWDYRFTWLRDASLILYALMTLGYDDEAADFIHWLERTIDQDPSRTPQIMYGIDGRRELTERTLDHLEGYRQSTPVRIGNAAAAQRQLDIYGEVLRAAALHYHVRHADPHAAWPVLSGLVEQAAADWQDTGHGIWEARTGPAQYTYGKLMCWAALDAGVKLASEYHLQAPIEKWCSARDEVRQAILEHAYDDSLGTFTQSFGSQTLDASSLVIPRIGFLPPTDPRVVSTVHQLQDKLTRHGLAYRYRAPDGLRGSEGTFTLCTFWLADALALTGQLEDAHAVFTRGLDACNDLGLLAEEVDPTNGDQLGNFPQGFSHLALIGAAVDLDKIERHGREQADRAHTEVDRAAR